MAIADKIRDIFKSSNMAQIDELGQEDFYKAKKPSKEELAELGIDEDDIDDVYAEGSEEDFDEEEYEGENEEEDETEDEEETEEEEEDEEKMKKSAMDSLMQDQSVLEETIMELIKHNKSQTKEIGFLKSKVEKFLDEPANPKKPLFYKSQVEEEGISSSEVKNKIKEGMKDGALSTSDMLAWEGSRRLSPNAKNYIAKENK